MEFDIQCLYEILETRFDISEKELQEADSFSDLGLDSIAIMCIMQELEEVLNVEFNNTNLGDLDSVPKLYKYICNYPKIREKS
ncbi:MAG TPA: hypothetical protein DCW90_19335 [Lachnospiraceae bacterium]|nr:acyl carrier protein [uncultured Lachnoclostridium sp.]HAU87558.1 hypothetical protein [Lachnospiraceae bacterium]